MASSFEHGPEDASGTAGSQGDGARHAGGGSAAIVLTMPRRDRLVRSVSLPVLGVLAALLLPPLARWLLGFGTALPVRPLFLGLGAIDHPWQIGVAVALGLLAGFGAAAVLIERSATVTVAGEAVRVQLGDRTRTAASGEVRAVFLDGKRLVALDDESRQLFRVTLEARPETTARAFQTHGYPWQASDPYHDLFTRWRAGTEGVPEALRTLLSTRELALRKRAVAEADDLREVAQRLGFVIREEGTSQYWRPLVSSNRA